MTKIQNTAKALALAAALVPPLWLAGAGQGAAENFSTTEVQLLYGDGFKLGRNGINGTKRATATFEHFSTWDYGDNFFFVDVTKDYDGPFTPQTDEYGEFWSHLSGSKTLGWDFGDGFLRDVTLGAGINFGTDFFIGALGPRFDLNVPGFNLLTFGLYAYDNWEDPFGRNLDTTYQATIVWNATLMKNDRINLWTQGFVDFIGDQSSGVNNQVVFQPQVRLDLGQLMGGTPGKVEVGMEYAYFKNKFGVTGVEDNVIQAMVVFNLH